MMKNNSGFTLTELGVVMAIFGLIVAGIFAAAAPVFNSAKINRGINELAEIVNNVAVNSARFSISTLEKLPQGCKPFTDDEQRRKFVQDMDNKELLGSMVFPDSMVYRKGKESTMNLMTPWSTDVTKNHVEVKFCKRNPNEPNKEGIGVFIKYDDIPGGEACAEFVMRSAELIAGAKLSDIRVGGSDNLLDDGRISLKDVTKACGNKRGDIKGISWFFKLTSGEVKN
ncbi:MAG: type II secretion system GspH family protein [Alphaproteobacteria bacterium]|nr:type II secretion system GspH family protein [Alphaproteobacteria bacterium]MCL2505380.1 type II secretion system GspH family protein [Alphaproteobacteria bacterium]